MSKVGQFRKQPSGFATRAIHVGQAPENWNDMAVSIPIVMSSTYKQDSPGNYRIHEYSRTGNVTRCALEECLASLENGKYGLAFATGMGASTAVSHLLSSGDHIICGDDMYGGTNRLFTTIVPTQGKEVTFVDLTNLENLKMSLRPETRMVFFETPTNPTMKVYDIEAIVQIVRNYSKDIITVIDNTFLSPYYQRPLEMGIDISLQSISKYINGHDDIVMGGCSMRDENLFNRLKLIQISTGIVPSPFDCYQVLRGMKTLAIRMEHVMNVAIKIALHIENNPYVEKVLHPALSSHPQHELAIRQAYGHSGVFSFFLKGGMVEVNKFFKALKYFALAGSLGGVHSLALTPNKISHIMVKEEVRLALGITDNLIRLSVGLEDVEDLIKDLDQALEASQK